jgi:tetratricopeptide (TPR) repeat protein
MIPPRESAAPIIAAGLAYWTKWVKPFKRTPTPLFVSKEPLILHAATLGAALQETRQAAVELSLAIFPLLECSGLWPAWRPLLELFRDHLDQFDQRTQVILLNRLCQIYRMRLKLTEATAMHEQSLAIVAQLPDDKILRHTVHFQLGEDYWRIHRYAEAKEHALEAIRLATNIPEAEIGLANSYNTLALIAWNTGKTEELERWSLLAISIWERHNLLVELARTLIGLGEARARQGKLEEAIAIYEQSMVEARKVGSLIDVVKAKYSAGCAYMNYEQYSRAEKFFRDAGAELQRHSHQYPFNWAQIVNNIGGMLIRQGRHGEAESFLRQAVLLWRQMGDDLGEANSMDSLAEALCGQGRAAEGCDLYREALRLIISQRHEPGAANLYDAIYKEYVAHCPGMIDDDLPQQL